LTLPLNNVDPVIQPADIAAILQIFATVVSEGINLSTTPASRYLLIVSVSITKDSAQLALRDIGSTALSAPPMSVAMAIALARPVP